MTHHASTPPSRAVWLEGSTVHLLDQRELPHQHLVLRLPTYQDTTIAIRDMAVRGAGAIGVAAGYAAAQAVLAAPAAQFRAALAEAGTHIKRARPTAKNLFYAVDRVMTAAGAEPDIALARRRAVEEAEAIYADDARQAAAIGQAGLEILPTERAVLTHCNTGWLALSGWGTALGILHTAHQAGRKLFVYATETRPRSQGAKLTAWELQAAGIPHALIADTAAGALMAQGRIGLVVVGADRIAANGDTANKIGTYQLAVLARAHQIPFYVAAPSSTFDADCPSGANIPIEERDPREVLEVSGVDADGVTRTVRIAAAGVHALNPAFDVTPAALIEGFVTECGIIRPERGAIARFLAEAPTAHLRGSASPAV